RPPEARRGHPRPVLPRASGRPAPHDLRAARRAAPIELHARLSDGPQDPGWHLAARSRGVSREQTSRRNGRLHPRHGRACGGVVVAVYWARVGAGLARVRAGAAGAEVPVEYAPACRLTTGCRAPSRHARNTQSRPEYVVVGATGSVFGTREAE